MTAQSAAILINILGFITGAALYIMLLSMVFRPRVLHSHSTSIPSRYKVNRLLLITGILGLLWNIGAFTIYGLPDLGIDDTFPLLTVISFTMLGFLPAVVVHLVLKKGKSLNRTALGIAGTAYLLSTIAGGTHLYALWAGQLVPSHIALHILTIGFVALIIALLIFTSPQLRGRQFIWVVALAVFAVSASHLSHHEQENYPWWIELLGHHASMPLALAILYQDYRFALADIFIRRALSLVLLVIISFSLYIYIAAPLLAVRDAQGESTPRAVGLLLGLWVATALCYPKLLQGVIWFVDTVILRRVDYEALRTEIIKAINRQESPESILNEVCQRLTPALTAHKIIWQEQESSADTEVTTIPILTAELPAYQLVIGELSGGRRLLSEDLAMLELVALMTARRIDTVRVAHARCHIDLREQEISKLATEAELRALQAQLNPHFLFNALTTIGYLIQTTPDKAFDTLMRLTGLLRGVLRHSDGDFSALKAETDLIKAYLDIEQARFEERLQVKIELPPALESVRIPSLLIQPLVENAIKHGISPHKSGGEVTIIACANPQTAQLIISVENTGTCTNEIELARNRKHGVGLNNIERRLKCHYGDAAYLKISSQAGKGTIVTVTLPITGSLDELRNAKDNRQWIQSG